MEIVNKSMESTLPDNKKVNSYSDSSTNVIGIVSYKLEDLIEIKNTLKDVNSYEYQVHYTSLNRIVEYPDSSKTIMVFPLIYFNYKQEVSYASIDVEMTDVIEELKKYEEPTKILALDLKRRFKELDDKEINENVKVSYTICMLNNVHKHP
ncbi:hypothetical protein ACSM79_001695 [Campylobacter coli]